MILLMLYPIQTSKIISKYFSYSVTSKTSIYCTPSSYIISWLFPSSCIIIRWLSPSSCIISWLSPSTIICWMSPTSAIVVAYPISPASSIVVGNTPTSIASPCSTALYLTPSFAICSIMFFFYDHTSPHDVKIY